MGKQVVFVDGTIFSGSTLLQYQIANDQSGFAGGEIAWLFWPMRVGHVYRLRYCTPESAGLWREVYRRGVENVYQTIFELRPEVRFIVDSSKSPYWTKTQEFYLHDTDIAVKRLLVWKTPLELAASMRKRDRFDEWRSTWLVYHRLYASMVDNWRAIPYQVLASQPSEALNTICNYLGIPYFSGKEDYWRREYMALGGNMTARFHLERPDQAQAMLNVTHDRKRMHQYRTTSYAPITDPELLEEVNTAQHQQPEFHAIETMLRERSLPHGKNAMLPDELRYQSWSVSLRKMKQRLTGKLGHIRYGSRIEQALNERVRS